MKSKQTQKTFGSKHVDNLKLLLSDKELIHKINEIRSVLEMDPKMFSDKSTDDVKNLLSKKWTEDAIERSDKIHGGEYYNNALKIIRESLKNKEINIKEANERSEKVHLILPFNYLTKSIEDIVVEYNVPEHYRNSIKHYIFFGSIQQVPALPFSLKMFNKNKKTVTLEIYEELTDKDLINLKKYVNVYFGKDLPKIRPIHDVDLKIKAEEKYDNRKYFDTYYSKDRMVSTRDMAEDIKEETGKYINGKQIYEYSREVKNLRDKRFGKK